MKSSLNTRILLVVMLGLVGIKFLLMPVIDWQDQLIDTTAQVEKRNLKAENLLASESDIIMQLAETDKQLKALFDLYPKYPDSTIFRLDTQTKLEKMLRQHSLRQTQFFWRTDEDEQVKGQLYMATFNVNFVGKAKVFAAMHTKIAAEQKHFRVRNMRINYRGQKAESFGYADVILTIEAYYWRGEQA